MEEEVVASSQLKTKYKEKKINNKKFANPTFDITFKMLFATESNKHLLISFLNNLLGFEYEDIITSLDIMNPILGKETNNGIQSTIDVRCKTNNFKDISIEMQRKNTKYFLARTQDYMCKVIATQVKEGDGKEYHMKLMDTYILVLSKSNLFLKENELFGDSNSFYEKTFVPMCLELNNIVFPGNKLHWIFFELENFKQYTKNRIIDKKCSLKMQWLDFFVNCSNNLIIPEDINEIIKKGYNIMEMAYWNSEEKLSYEKLMADKYDEKLTRAEEIEQAKKKGELKGKLKGELKGELKLFKMIKNLEKKGINVSEFLCQIKYKDKIQNYLNKNPNFNEETESQICDKMDIENLENL